MVVFFLSALYLQMHSLVPSAQLSLTHSTLSPLLSFPSLYLFPAQLNCLTYLVLASLVHLYY